MSKSSFIELAASLLSSNATVMPALFTSRFSLSAFSSIFLTEAIDSLDVTSHVSGMRLPPYRGLETVLPKCLPWWTNGSAVALQTQVSDGIENSACKRTGVS